MFAKLLNGDLISLGEEPLQNAIDVKQKIASFLSVQQANVCAQKMEEFWIILLNHKPIIQLPNLPLVTDHLMEYSSWLSTCNNESILLHFLPHVEKYPPLMANPHPLLVDTLLHFPQKFEKQFVQHFCVNPNDTIVDCLLDSGETWNRTICLNKNPRIQRAVLNAVRERKWFMSRNDLINMTEYISDPNIFQEIWSMFTPEQRTVLYRKRLICEDACKKVLDDLKALPHLRIEDCPFLLDDEEVMKECLTRVQGFVFPSAMAKNPCDCVVEWFLNRERLLKSVNDEFCQNTNQRAVQYVIDHPEIIYWQTFVMNSNELAVAYTLSHIDEVFASLSETNQGKLMKSIIHNRSPEILVHLIRINHPALKYVTKDRLMKVFSNTDEYIVCM